MKSKTTSAAKTIKPEKTSTPVKAGKTNGLVSKTEKTNSPGKAAKANGATKKTIKQPAASRVKVSQAETAKRHDTEQLRERAYFNYLSEGCPEDRAMQHWLDAEAQMAGE